MKKPELSIVLPIYNVGDFLNECLQSIHNQTFTDWEAILVDDGSTDFSGIMCDSWAKKDSRFKVIHQKNAGVSSARNAGIDAAQGELLSFIDPDDFISENFYSDMISELRKENADYAVAKFVYVDEQGKYSILNEGFKVLNKLLKFNPERIYMKGSNNPPDCAPVTAGCWGYVFTRNIWGTNRFPDGVNYGEESVVLPCIWFSANIAVYVESSVYYYRMRNNSLVRSKFTETKLEHALLSTQISHYETSKILSPEDLQTEKFVYFINDLIQISNFRDDNREKKGSLIRTYIDTQKKIKRRLNDYKTRFEIPDTEMD